MKAAVVFWMLGWEWENQKLSHSARFQWEGDGSITKAPERMDLAAAGTAALVRLRWSMYGG
jgi:hypothetical protein